MNSTHKQIVNVRFLIDVGQVLEISALGRHRQEGNELEASLNKVVRACQRKKRVGRRGEERGKRGREREGRRGGREREKPKRDAREC